MRWIWYLVPFFSSCLALLAPAAASESEEQHFMADCRIVVGNATVLDQRCPVWKSTANGQDSSVEVNIDGINNPDVWAMILISGDETADGYWNGGGHSTHAQDPLGQMTHQGDCWVSGEGRICTNNMKVDNTYVEAPLAEKGISIFGIDWSMTQDQVVSVIEDRGFECQEEPRFVGSGSWKGQASTELKCKSQQGTITLTDSEYTFSCDVFNICGYTTRKTAQALVDHGIVDQMEYTPQDISLQKRLIGINNGYDVLQNYCSIGPSGDKLCVTAGIFGGSDVLDTVTLKKANFGHSVNFD